MGDKNGQTGGNQSLPASHDHVRKSLADTPKDKCLCGMYIEDAIWILCETCEHWHHTQCVKLSGLTKDMVEAIKNYECPFCLVGALVYQQYDNTQDMKKVVQDAVKSELNTVKEELKEMVHKTMKESTPVVVSEVVERTKQSYAAAVKVSENQKVVRASQEVVEEVTRKIDSDKVERERRRLNVVVMKVPESQAISSGQRHADDMRFCYEKLLMKKTDINKIWRAGKKDANNQDYCRPLIIQLVDEETVDYWTDDGKGYMTESGHWVNKDLCAADRRANFLVRSERRKRMAMGQNEKKPTL